MAKNILGTVNFKVVNIWIVFSMSMMIIICVCFLGRDEGTRIFYRIGLIVVFKDAS